MRPTKRAFLSSVFGFLASARPALAQFGGGLWKAYSAGGGGSNLPATQTVAFGAKTRKGFGGHDLAYTGAGTLSITGGNTGSIWAIDARNHLVPAGTYAAAPPSYSGPYTLTVTDGSSTSTVTVNITTGSSGAAHIREMQTYPGGSRQDGTAVPQINTMMELQYDAAGGLAGGDTILCRDGWYNPLQDQARVRPQPPHPFCAFGRITIQSENIDATLDADGVVNQGGGFKLGNIYYQSFDIGDVLWPFDFQNVTFYYDHPTVDANEAFQYWGNQTLGGINYYNCRVEYGPHVAFAGTLSATFNGFFPGIHTQQQCKIHDCYFKNLPYGVEGDVVDSSNPTAVEIIRCHFIGIVNDCMQISGTGYTITDNFGRAWASDASQYDDIHADTMQHLGFKDNADHTGTATILRNIFFRNGTAATAASGQGIPYFSDSTGTSTISGIVAKNNINFLDGGNSGYFLNCNGPIFRYNTSLTDFNGNGRDKFEASFFATGGSGGNFDYNVHGGSSDVSGQTGSPTTTGNIAIATQSNGAYQAVFPNFTGAVVTRAQAIIAFAPVYTSDTVYPGALFPPDHAGVISWNDGTTFVKSADHVQAV